MARLIRLEKQRALDEVDQERQRLKMLEKQLNAELIGLKQDKIEFNKSKVIFRFFKFLIFNFYNFLVICKNSFLFLALFANWAKK